MKILHTITTINLGGAENHLFELVSAQRKRGDQVMVAYLKGDGYWRSSLERLGVTVLALGLERYGDLGPLRRLVQAIVQFCPEVVHAHLPPAELYTRVALLWFGKRYLFVCSKHNDEPFATGRLSDVLGRWVTKRADGVIAISGSVEQRCKVKWRTEHARTFKIPYGVSVECFSTMSSAEYASLRSEISPFEGRIVVGTIARLVPQKNINVLIEAAKVVNAACPDEFDFVIVGDGELRSRLVSQIVELGLEANVRLLGHRPDALRLHQCFDIFCLPSYYEGLGLVILEAMAAGRPVVAGNRSAMAETVCDGISGLHFEAGSPSSLAEKIIALRDPARRTEMGRNGREIVKKRYSVEEMVTKTEACYRRISRKKSGA